MGIRSFLELLIRPRSSSKRKRCGRDFCCTIGCAGKKRPRLDSMMSWHDDDSHRSYCIYLLSCFVKKPSDDYPLVKIY